MIYSVIIINMLFMIVYLFIYVISGNTDIISIPNQYPTISTAVKAAKSGDEIRISTFVLAWQPMVIENKDIIIKGDIPNYLPHFQGSTDFPSYMLIIRNSHVTLEYLNMDDFYRTYDLEHKTSPIRIESGSLTMRYCTYTGEIWTRGDCILDHTFIRGNAFQLTYFTSSYYFETTSSQPAILIGPGNNIHFTMINSYLDCDWQYGFHAIEIQGVNQRKIVIHKSRITGGSYFFRGNPASVNSPVNGSSGLQINDCTNLLLDLSDSSFIGGAGYSAGPNIDWSAPDIIRAAGLGGDGLTVINSSIQLEGGYFVGGSGGAGHVGTIIGVPDRIQRGGWGGCGISVYNSQVQWKDVTAKGGPGGPGNNTTPGEDGKPIYIDDKSTWFEMTPVRVWKNY